MKGRNPSNHQRRSITASLVLGESHRGGTQRERNSLNTLQSDGGHHHQLQDSKLQDAEEIAFWNCIKLIMGCLQE